MSTVYLNDITIDSMEIDLDSLASEIDVAEMIEAMGEEEVLDEIDVAAAVEHYDQDEVIDALDLDTADIAGLASKLAGHFDDWTEAAGFCRQLLAFYSKRRQDTDQAVIQALAETK